MAHYDGVYVVDLVSLHRLRHEVMLDADVLVLNNVCDADLLPVIRDRKAGASSPYTKFPMMWRPFLRTVPPGLFTSSQIICC